MAIGLLAMLALLAAPSFEGEFVSGEGGTLSLRQTGTEVVGTLSEGGMTAAVRGLVRDGALRGVFKLMGENVSFTARLQGGDLQLRLAGDDEVETYRRKGSAPAAAAPAPVPVEASVPKAAGGAGAGRLYRADYDGWSVRLPEGWDGAEREGKLVLGSRTEAGLIVVQAVAERAAERLAAGLQEDLAELGLTGTVPALRAVEQPGGAGLFAELPVTARDGAALRLRAMAVTGARGTVAVLGLTTAEKMGGLRSRVDAMARSVQFFEPRESPGAQFVVGEWWSFSSAGLGYSGGTERSLALCRDGSFYSSSESSYSGGAGTSGAWGAVGGGSSAGSRWRAVGTRAAGRITVTRANGTTFDIGYRAEQGGDGVYFDGRLYGRTGERKRCR